LDRLEALRQDVTPFCDVLVPRAAVHTKRMFALGDAGGIAAHVSGLHYATDGFILTPNRDGPPGPGTAPNIYKLKTCHTLDFLWNAGQLWFGEAEEMLPASYFGLSYDAAQLRAVPFGTIVEMAPQQDKDGNVVMLHLFLTRPDKNTANSFVTVQRTLQSVRDNVTLECIQAALTKPA
jgi:hypothetical protein